MRYEESWKIVWESKIPQIRIEDILGSLVTVNGFDTGCGDYSTDQWRLMTKELSKMLTIKKMSKVLEVGCGAGALLYGIQSHTGAKIFGYDYSSNLIEVANQHVVGDFRVSEATINPFNQIKFDVAISHSVFQYFHDEEYAFKAVETMAHALIQGGRIALLDLNDSDFEKTYHNDRRLNYKNPADYDEKYKNLPHLFISRKRLILALEKMGFFRIKLIKHPIAEYKNSKYRFNVIATKM